MKITKTILMASLAANTAVVFAADDNSTITVTANRFIQPVSSVLAPMDIITRDQIDQWQDTSVVDTLKRLPGIDFGQNGGQGQLTSIFVRGTNSSHVLVLIDGIRLSSGNLSGGVDFSQIPLALVQRIEYVRGARSAVYGSDAIGGVINIITKRQDNGGSVNVRYGSHNYRNYNGSVQQQINATTLSLAGEYTDYKGYNVYPSSKLPDDGDTDGFRNRTLWGSVEHQFTDQLSAFVRGFGYKNTIQYDMIYPGSYNKRQFYSHNYNAGITYNRENYSSQLIVSYQKDKDYNFDKASGVYSSSSNLNKIEGQTLQWGHVISFDQGTISAGFDWRREHINPANQNYTNINKGLYLTAQKQFNQFTLEAALRSDDYSKFDWHSTWQTAASWAINDNIRTTLSYATAFREPTIGQQFGSPWSKGNPNLKPEKSDQWEWGIEGAHDIVNWRFAAYHNKVTDIIAWENNQYFNIKKATIKGAEFDASIDTGMFSHHFIAEYLDARDDKTGDILLRRPHKKFKYQMDASLGSINVFGAYAYSGKAKDSKTTLGGYSLFDVGISYVMMPDLIIRGKINNIFDKNYQTVEGYATAGRELFITTSFNF